VALDRGFSLKLRSFHVKVLLSMYIDFYSFFMIIFLPKWDIISAYEFLKQGEPLSQLMCGLSSRTETLPKNSNVLLLVLPIYMWSICFLVKGNYSLFSTQETLKLYIISNEYFLHYFKCVLANSKSDGNQCPVSPTRSADLKIVMCSNNYKLLN
jgi:hypothetical protein